jgi:hypothetical protein
MRLAAALVIAGALGCGARTELEEPARSDSRADSAAVLELALLSSSFAGGCMPHIPRDPTNTSFRVRYANRSTGSDASARIADVRIVADPSGEVVWRTSVAPDRSGMLSPGASIEITHASVRGSGSGPRHGCELCGTRYRIEIDIESGSVTRTLRGDVATMECTE